MSRKLTKMENWRTSPRFRNWRREPRSKRKWFCQKETCNEVLTTKNAGEMKICHFDSVSQYRLCLNITQREFLISYYRLCEVVLVLLNSSFIAHFIYCSPQFCIVTWNYSPSEFATQISRVNYGIDLQLFHLCYESSQRLGQSESNRGLCLHVCFILELFKCQFICRFSGYVKQTLLLLLPKADIVRNVWLVGTVNTVCESISLRGFQSKLAAGFLCSDVFSLMKTFYCALLFSQWWLVFRCCTLNGWEFKIISTWG